VYEQLFRLNGEMWDLEELTIAFPKGSVTVKKVGDFFYLGVEMESGKSDEEIRSSGENALNRMNATCLVRDERFRPPSIAGVTSRDPVTGLVREAVIVPGST
jgi:hypothetical protein